MQGTALKTDPERDHPKITCKTVYWMTKYYTAGLGHVRIKTTSELRPLWPWLTLGGLNSGMRCNVGGNVFLIFLWQPNSFAPSNEFSCIYTCDSLRITTVFIVLWQLLSHQKKVLKCSKRRNILHVYFWIVLQSALPVWFMCYIMLHTMLVNRLVNGSNHSY